MNFLKPLLTYFKTWIRPNQIILIKVNGKPITVELALNLYQRGKGLSFRNHLPDDYGMLFVYRKPGKPSFWMKHTRIPLSIAYINANSVIKQISQMKPRDKAILKSKDMVQYALEVNLGWFEKNGIKVGDKIKINFPESVVSYLSVC